MLEGITGVVVVFIILAIGFYFTKRGKWPENTNKVFSIAVVSIAAPALAVTSIENRFTPEILKASIRNVLIITASLLIMYFLGKLMAKAFGMNKKKSAVFITTLTFNNTIFIGLPINQLIFGDEGLPYLFTFYIVTIVLFWSLGALTLQGASDNVARTFSPKNILSPGLIGVIIGCFLVSLRLHLPLILESALTYLGNMCVPLSLLVIGSNLSKTLSEGMIRISPDHVFVLMGKFVIHPLILWGMFTLAGVSGLPLKVFILTGALPCHAQTAIMSEYYELEGKYASNLVSLSTLVSLFTIPVYATILL